MKLSPQTAWPFAVIPLVVLSDQVTPGVDLNGDGVDNAYYPVSAQETGVSGTPAFNDYYQAAVDDLKADHPNADPTKVVVKATIYGPNGEETYYKFTGLEEAADDGDDDGCHRDGDDRDDEDRDGHHR